MSEQVADATKSAGWIPKIDWQNLDWGNVDWFNLIIYNIVIHGAVLAFIVVTV
jgi:flotillin